MAGLRKCCIIFVTSYPLFVFFVLCGREVVVGGVGVLRVAISLISTFWLFAGMVNSYVLLHFIIPFFSLLSWFGLWAVVTFVVLYFLTLIVLVACPVSSPHLTRDVLTALMMRKISPCFFYTH